MTGQGEGEGDFPIQQNLYFERNQFVIVFINSVARNSGLTALDPDLEQPPLALQEQPVHGAISRQADLL